MFLQSEVVKPLRALSETKNERIETDNVVPQPLSDNLRALFWLIFPLLLFLQMRVLLEEIVTKTIGAFHLRVSFVFCLVPCSD